MTIKQVSGKTGLSSYTLRYYEKIGLIKPVQRDRSGHRNYFDEDLELIDFIQKLKSTGMQIKDITRYISLLDSNEDSYSERLEILEKHRARIKKRIQTAQEFLNIINYKIEWYKENGGVLKYKK
jgi:DNA-binding transcriptional MerR regulator